jgi:NADH-quinone oxidoreductase subunit N
MTVLLLAQAGVPVTSGFIAKFGVIRAAVSVESYPLAIVAMVAAVVAAYLYLRIMVTMFFENVERSAIIAIRPCSSVAISVAVVVAVLVGLFPGVLVTALSPIQF